MGLFADIPMGVVQLKALQGLPQVATAVHYSMRLLTTTTSVILLPQTSKVFRHRIVVSAFKFYNQSLMFKVTKCC